MRLKKILSVAFVLATILTFAVGCSSGEETETETSTESSTEEGIDIAVVTSPSGVDDGNFNENIYNGAQNFVANRPECTVTAIQETTGDPAAAVNAVADVVADYDVFICAGFQFAGISQVALDNPDKKFILVDATPTPIDGQDTFDNILSLTYQEEQSGFFAGVAAALETETGKVACVNGVGYPSNVNYQYGFESGVNYANEVYGTNAEIVELPTYAGTDVNGNDVGGNYVGSFDDQAQGKVVGEALINEGVDIIFVSAGGAGNGVFTAAKEAGNVKVIGCDVDQYDDGANGSENIVLTSVLKVMDQSVEAALESILDGTFEGGNLLLGADTGSTGFVSEEGRHQMSDDTVTKLNETYELVADGTIVPASNFNGYSPEAFPGLPSYTE